jgi:ABC-type glycerol-3-phosphate transport system permease component
LCIIAFTTPAWCVNSRTHHFEGLLESCVCAANNQSPPKWFIFSQVASVVVLVAIFAAAFLAYDHYYVHFLSKSSSIVAVALICFISVIHMMAIFITYGLKRNGLDWSYGLTVAGSCLFAIAGSLAVLQRFLLKGPEHKTDYYKEAERNISN